MYGALSKSFSLAFGKSILTKRFSICTQLFQKAFPGWELWNEHVTFVESVSLAFLGEYLTKKCLFYAQFSCKNPIFEFRFNVWNVDLFWDGEHLTKGKYEPPSTSTPNPTKKIRLRDQQPQVRKTQSNSWSILIFLHGCWSSFEPQKRHISWHLGTLLTVPRKLFTVLVSESIAESCEKNVPLCLS